MTYLLTLSRMGCLLSAAALFSSLFGRGLRRYAGVWVAVTSGFFWNLLGLGAALSGG